MKGGKPNWQNFSEQELQLKIDEAKTIKDFLISLGYKSYKSIIKTDIIQAHPNLDFSKFTDGIFQDLTNQVFGRLTVIERDNLKTDEVWWKCKCECGRTTSVRAYALKNKNKGVKSCGCLLNESRYNKIKKLDGQKFGHLLVIKRDFSIDDGRVRYLCECDCKNKTQVVILADNLKRGHTTSCGCIRSKGENKISEILNKNNIEFKREFSFEDLKTDKNTSLRFDFAIFKNKKLFCLLECQGIQHYNVVDFFGGHEKFQQQQNYDSLKRDYCKEKNIKLIEIPYWDYDKIDEEYVIKKLRLNKS